MHATAKLFPICVAVAICCCSGCDVSTINRPHGMPWTSCELSLLHGWWKIPDGSGFARIMPIGKGKVAVTIHRELDGLPDDEAFAVITHLDGHDFLYCSEFSFGSEGEGDSTYMFFRVIHIDAESFVLAEADEAVFAEAVSAGQLAGYREGRGKGVRIEADTASFREALKAQNVGASFQVTNPLLFKKAEGQLFDLQDFPQNYSAIKSRTAETVAGPSSEPR